MQNIIFRTPSCRASFIVKGDRRHTGSLEKALQYHSFDLENPEDCYALSTGFVSTSALSPILSALMSLVPPFRWATLNRLKEEYGLSYGILVEIVTQTDSPQFPMQIPKECIDFLDETKAGLSFAFECPAEEKSAEIFYKGKATFCAEHLSEKALREALGMPPALFSQGKNGDYCVFEGAVSSDMKNGVPSASFFEDLLERSENVSRLKGEYGAKSTIDLMIYPKEFFDFEAAFTLSPAAISLARQTDSELWLDIS
jgi:hypothetical protein